MTVGMTVSCLVSENGDCLTKVSADGISCHRVFFTSRNPDRSMINELCHESRTCIDVGRAGQ